MLNITLHVGNAPVLKASGAQLIRVCVLGQEGQEEWAEWGGRGLQGQCSERDRSAYTTACQSKRRWEAS